MSYHFQDPYLLNIPLKVNKWAKIFDLSSCQCCQRCHQGACVGSFVSQLQCDQKKIAKCLLKLPKNDFTRKIIDFDTIIKIA